jgi:septum formation protein
LHPPQAQLSIILASTSPRRKALLQELGLSFRVEPSRVSEEVIEKVEPSRYVEMLAERKACDVASRIEGEAAVVIGSDTVVVLDQDILGKPQDEAHAFAMLSRLQGKTHEVFTGVSIVACPRGKVRTAHASTRVTMEPLSAEQIHRYIATGEPMDKAGYFTVVGLPLGLLSKELREFGVCIL